MKAQGSFIVINKGWEFLDLVFVLLASAVVLWLAGCQLAPPVRRALEKTAKGSK